MGAAPQNSEDSVFLAKQAAGGYRREVSKIRRRNVLGAREAKSAYEPAVCTPQPRRMRMRDASRLTTMRAEA